MGLCFRVGRHRRGRSGPGASLLATAVAGATRTAEPVTDSLRSAARAAGAEIGAAQWGRPVAAVPDDHG